MNVNELVQKVGLSPDVLNQRCSEDHLREISLFIDQWATVAPYLGLDGGNMESIRIDAHSEPERRLKMLQIWKGKFVFNATYRALVDAFLKLGLSEKAEKVCLLLGGM